MSYFAKVLNNKVIKVIAADQEFIDNYVDNSPGEWIQTSYNTRGGVHYEPNSNIPSEDQSKALRHNFAAIGGNYDPEADVFYGEKPFNSWTIDENWEWQPPVEKPEGDYYWNEELQQWENIE